MLGAVWGDQSNSSTKGSVGISTPRHDKVVEALGIAGIFQRKAWNKPCGEIKKWSQEEAGGCGREPESVLAPVRFSGVPCINTWC